MDDIIKSIIPFGIGILMSPEIFVVGLLIAASEESSVRNVWLFFVCGLVGLAIPFMVGFSIASAAAPSHPEYRFLFRLVLGIVLIILGVVLFIRQKHRHREIKLPKLAGKRGFLITLLLGFVCTLMNPKAAPLAIPAGQTISRSHAKEAFEFASIIVFFSIASVPLIFPALLRTVVPGVVRRITVPCNRLLENYGRWITLIVCLGIGMVLIRNAFALR